ncbi:hypothetical protein INT48_001030 [Thamnidium elegans]|uniref:Uncharacterized protein n=1 Tax=Thamnidium elegans TaxID=101142 RepID=A0A8H7SUH6_9FUNG|nr:hypothetical protein INT48_001030 [Thamnidium elegans]
MNPNKRSLAPAKIAPKEASYCTNPNTQYSIASKEVNPSTNPNTRSLTTTKIAPKEASSSTNSNTRLSSLTKIAPKAASSSPNPYTRYLTTTDVASKETSSFTNSDTRSLTTSNIPSIEASSSATGIVPSIKKKKQVSWYEDNDSTREFCSYDLLIQFLLKDNGKEHDIYTGKLEGKKIEVIDRAVKYFNGRGYTHRKGPSTKSKLETIFKAYTIANEKENSPLFRQIDPSRQDAILEGICRGYKRIKEHRENTAREETITVSREVRPRSPEVLRKEEESDVGSDGSGEEEQRRPKKKAKLSALDLQKNHIADALKVHQAMKREQYAHERKEAIRKIKMQLPEMLMKGIEYDIAKGIVDDILSSYKSEE